MNGLPTSSPPSQFWLSRPNWDAQYTSARVYVCRFPPRLGELGSAKATSITDVSRYVRSGNINLLPNGEQGQSNTSRKSIVPISLAVLRPPRSQGETNTTWKSRPPIIKGQEEGTRGLAHSQGPGPGWPQRTQMPVPSQRNPANTTHFLVTRASPNPPVGGCAGTAPGMLIGSSPQKESQESQGLAIQLPGDLVSGSEFCL